MEDAGLVELFFRRRWPDGFVCPGCGHRSFSTIRTRRLPLYECRFCGKQTTVTAGTVMDKTRTPLAKWAAAIETLASSSGLNAKQLACAIGASHKAAWLMLRKFRQAIGEAEAAMKLRGEVHTGLEIMAPKYIFIFLPHRRYRCERVVAVSASIGADGSPNELKLSHVPPELLVPGQKEPTAYGKSQVISSHTQKDADCSWLAPHRMDHSPLRHCVLEARSWMNRLFYGVASKSLQTCLDEFCFRWNVAARGSSPVEDWYRICFYTA